MVVGGISFLEKGDYFAAVPQLATELMVTSCSVSTSVNISMVQNRRSYLLISSRVVLVGYLARGKPLISALGGQPHIFSLS